VRRSPFLDSPLLFFRILRIGQAPPRTPRLRRLRCLTQHFSFSGAFPFFPFFFEIVASLLCFPASGIQIARIVCRYSRHCCLPPSPSYSLFNLKEFFKTTPICLLSVSTPDASDAPPDFFRLRGLVAFHRDVVTHVFGALCPSILTFFATSCPLPCLFL